MHARARAPRAPALKKLHVAASQCGGAAHFRKACTNVQALRDALPHHGIRTQHTGPPQRKERATPYRHQAAKGFGLVSSDRQRHHVPLSKRFRRSANPITSVLSSTLSSQVWKRPLFMPVWPDPREA